MISGADLLCGNFFFQNPYNTEKYYKNPITMSKLCKPHTNKPLLLLWIILGVSVAQAI